MWNRFADIRPALGIDSLNFNTLLFTNPVGNKFADYTSIGYWQFNTLLSTNPVWNKFADITAVFGIDSLTFNTVLSTDPVWNKFANIVPVLGIDSIIPYSLGHFLRVNSV